MSTSKMRVLSEGIFEPFARHLVSLRCPVARYLLPSEPAIICCQLVGAHLKCPIMVGLVDLTRDSRDDLLNDFLLEFPDFDRVAIISLGQKMLACCGIHELNADSHPFTDPADVTFDNIPGAKFPADALEVQCRAAIRER